MKVSLILLFFLFTFSSLAADEIVAEKEGNFYGTTIREKELESQLLESDLYKNCKDKNKEASLDSKAQAINSCVKDALEGASESDIKKLAEKTDLASINAEQTKTAKGIREYLSERIARAIYGKDYDPKKNLQKTKYVDQTLFFELYAEQLGKNVLLEVSNYCLENLRYKDNLNSITTPATCFGSVKGTGDQADKLYLPMECMDNLVEVNYPLSASVSGADAALATVEKLKEASKNEIKTQSTNYFKEKSKFCARVINSMCTRYKCKTGNISDPDCNYLGALPTITEDKVFGKQTDVGAKACVVINRIRDYKKTITQINEVQKKLVETGKSGSRGFSQDAFKNVYDGAYQKGNGAGEESLSEITTISSREVTENSKLKDIYLTEEEAQEMKARCLQNPTDSECQKYVDSDFDEKEVAVETALNAETQVRLKELEDLKDNEKIKEYMTKLGLENLYSDELTPEELKALITKHYSSERQALVAEMNNKLKALKVKNSDGSEDKTKVAAVMENTIDNLSNEKDRLETVLHYNNVITSFLETTNEDGSKGSQNTVALQREFEDYDKYKAEDDTENANQYFNNVTGGEEIEKSDATGLEYMDYIDSVLGTSK